MKYDQRIRARRATEEELEAVTALQIHAQRIVGHLGHSAHEPHTNTFPFSDPRSTDVVIAHERNADAEMLVGTISVTLVEHSIGTSLEQIFPGVCMSIAHGNIAILWRFVILPASHNRLFVAMLLMAEALIAAEERHATHVLSVIDPVRHAPLYHDRIGLKEIAHTSDHSRSLVIGSLDEIRRNCHPIIKHFIMAHARQQKRSL
jgi:hypothetical protein